MKQRKRLFNGYQDKYFFENGYGASVIDHDFSRGLELAVLIGNEEKWSLCYDTEITDDVIGYLSNEEVEELLKRISQLPKAPVS